jgi:biopolymer transport protein ExbD
MSPLEDGDGEPGLLAEINTTPLVDVMLVLLIVFMVTMPVLTHALKVDLPRTQASPLDRPPARVTLTIDATGALRLDDAPVAADALGERLRQAASVSSDIELHIAADRAVPFERVTDAMSAARTAGLTKIGFVTQPRP